MKHLQKAPRKPLFNKEQGEVFISMLDDDLHKEIANKIFVDGMTNEEVAEEVGYSKRQMERIRISLMKTVLKILVEKHIPKKPKIYNNIYPKDLYECPLCECGLRANARWKDTYCPNCGVKIDWGDTK